MAGESIPVFGSINNHVTNGAAITNTAFSLDSDVQSNYTGNHGLARVVLECTFASAPNSNSGIILYRRDINLKGSNHAPIPSAANKNIEVGRFLVSTNLTQTLVCDGVPVWNECQLFIEALSGANINVGWTLDIKPYGYGANP